MKTFRSLVVLKRPQQELWLAMRDHLVDFAGNIADIKEVRQLERIAESECVVRLVNEWRVQQQIPAVVRSILKADELSWIDRNTWDTGRYVCDWSIEPRFLTEHIACSGTTSFAPAMGGQGTRVTFEGEFDLKPGILGSFSSVESLLSSFLESIVTTIIPRNLRAVVEAAAAFQLPAQ